MWRTLITGVALAALLHNPVSAQIVCGDQPKIAATSSAEEFKADASGKAQLLAKMVLRCLVWVETSLCGQPEVEFASK